MTAYKMRARRQ